MRKVTKSKTSSTARRKNLVATILREGVEMRPCTNYIKAGERCVADRAYNKCAGCVRTAKASCDLVVSQKDWDKLDNERIRLSKAVAVKRKEIAVTLKKISRLKSLQELLKTRAREIITREVQNIEELEVNKYREASVTTFKPVNMELNDFVFLDPSFWNPSDFFFDNFGEPPVRASDF